MKVRKIVRGIFSGVLTIGVVTAFGILSVGGAMALGYGALGVLITAFAFGGMPEGEVFFEEIYGGVKDLFTLGKRLEQQFVVESLRRLMANRAYKDNIDENSFLGEYRNLKKYLEKAKKRKLSKDKEIKRKQEEELRFAKTRVALMEAYFTDRVMNGMDKASYEGDDATTSAIMQKLLEEKKVIQHKKRFMRIAAIPISLLCGTGFAFMTASQLMPVVLASTFLASMSFMVWPLVAMAGVGYFFLMLHTIKDILASDWLAQWKDRFKRWFKRDDPGAKMSAEDVLKVIAKSLVLAAVVGICVAGLVAAGPVMWQFVKNGAAIAMNVTNAIAWVCRGFSVLLSAGMFVFSLFSSLESLDEVMAWCKNVKLGKRIREGLGEFHQKEKLAQNGSPSHALTRFAQKSAIVIKAIFYPVSKQWKKLRQEESLAQTLDPFRLIARVIQKMANFAVLLCHITANGLGGNQSTLMSSKSATGINAGNEAAQDFKFFTEKDGKKTLTYRLVTAVVSPLLFISAAYQTLVSQLNVDKPALNFKQALKNAFELNKKAFDEPLPAIQSTEWRTSVINSCFAKETKRLEGAVIGKEVAALKVVELEAVKAQVINHPNPESQEAVKGNVLDVHRLFSSNKPTHSGNFVREMKRVPAAMRAH